MDELTFYDGAYSGVQVDAAIARALAGGAIDQEIASLRAAVGSPLMANTIAEMTNTNRIYVYTGSEAGYNSGHWYYWNGSAWTDGGAYNSAAADDEMSDSSTNAVQNKVIKTYVDAVKTDLDSTTAKAKSAMDAALGAYPTETASGAIASTEIGADGVPLKALTVQIAPVQAPGTPTPETPLPISGWSAARVFASGKNLFDRANAITGYILEDGTENTDPVGQHSPLIPIKPGESVCVSGYYSSPQTIRIRLHGYDSSGSWVQQIAVTEVTSAGWWTVVATIPANVAYVAISFARVNTNVMLEYGAARTEYAPFVSLDTQTISLGQTVYGGTLTYSGNKAWTLPPTKAGVDLGTLSWTAQSLSGNRTAFYVPQSSLPAAPLIQQFSSDVPDALSSIATPTYQTASSWGVNSFLFTASAGILPASSLAYIFDANQFAGADEFRAAVSGQLLVYALATPAAPITLSADDVLSLPGDCNVWADCGDVEAVFRCDPTLALDQLRSAILALGNNT